MLRLLGATVAGVLLLLLPAAASATDFPVSNTNDSGAGSLRQAIIDANAQSGPDTITINVPSPPNTLTLLSALPTINGDVGITGPGQNQFTVNGADSFQVLRIQGGNVTISGLGITHGLCNSNAVCGAAGGGLFNAVGIVTLNNVAVTQSSTIGQGGGIYNTGTMTLNNVTVNANTSAESGGTDTFSQAGGIWNAGTLTLTQSTVSGNTASGTGATGQNAPEGGGIYNHTIGTLTIDRSTIDSNHVTADAAAAGGTANAPGGGIDNNGTLSIVRSTVSNNTASALNGSSNSALGAGIANGGSANVTLDRSTVSDNTVTAVDSHQGGGIFVSGTSFSSTSSTIAHNSAGTGANLSLQHAITLKNTIVSNPGGGGTDCFGTGFTTSQGFNLADDASCELEDATDQESINPMLAASLGSNGGLTQTYALQPGSPAIDQGKASAGETVDQRGQKRPSNFGSIPNASGGDGSDTGSFELQDTTPPDTIIDSGPSGVTNDPTPTFTFHSTEAGSTLRCKLDAGGAYGFTPCTSPRTIGHLLDGAHTFQVVAKDAAGNTDLTPASRSFTVKTAEVKRSGSTLVVTAAPGAKDNLLITRPSASTLMVSDLPNGPYSGSGIHTGPGCSRGGDYTATCGATGITKIQVRSGGGADRIFNATTVPGSLNGGPGNDALVGGLGNDAITGGPGGDSFKGRNGNDTLRARDLTSDIAINCDGGSTPGTADKADLDLLPKDPNSIVVGCETKTRH
jgi:hypothetical protein